MLPSEPAILLSFVNTKLRDEFADLAEFCAAYDADEPSLHQALRDAGYEYDAVKRRFQ